MRELNYPCVMSKKITLCQSYDEIRQIYQEWCLIKFTNCWNRINIFLFDKVEYKSLYYMGGPLLLLSSDISLYLYCMYVSTPIYLSIYLSTYLSIKREHHFSTTNIIYPIGCLVQCLEHCRLSDPCLVGLKWVFE